MQPRRIVQPDDQRPCLLRVPAPVATPGFSGQQGTQYRGHREEGKPDGNGLVHDVIEHLEGGKPRGDALPRQQDAGDDQGRHAEVDRPEGPAGLRTAPEDERLQAERGAQQPERGELVPASLAGLLLDQVGERHHRCQGESAVSDKIGRHMNLHPPALQRRHQGLDLVLLAHERVPQQESHRRTDNQHRKTAERAGFVPVLKIQVERRCHPAEQNEHFVEVAHRDVADVRSHQVALVPAHHRPDEGHGHGCPGETRPEPIESDGARGEHAAPVESRAHEEKQAHPQDC